MTTLNLQAVNWFLALKALSKSLTKFKHNFNLKNNYFDYTKTALAEARAVLVLNMVSVINFPFRNAAVNRGF